MVVAIGLLVQAIGVRSRHQGRRALGHRGECPKLSKGTQPSPDLPFAAKRPVLEKAPEAPRRAPECCGESCPCSSSSPASPDSWH